MTSRTTSAAELLRSRICRLVLQLKHLEQMRYRLALQLKHLEQTRCLLAAASPLPWFGEQLSETGATLKVAAPRRIAPITVSFFMRSPSSKQGFVRYEDFAPWDGQVLGMLRHQLAAKL